MVHGLGDGPNLGGDVLHLGLEAGQAVRQRPPAGVETGQRPELPLRVRDALAGPAALRQQRLADRHRARGDRLAVLRRGQLGGDLVGLARAQAPALDLGRLVLQDLQAAQQLPGVHRQLRERGPVRAPAVHGGGHGRPLLAVPAERVEQVPLPVLVQQPLLVVLAVDLHDAARRLAEPPGRDGLVVQARRGPARHADLAHGDQRLREPVEQRLDPRALRPVPDERRVRARARGQARARRSGGSCRRRSRRSAR